MNEIISNYVNIVTKKYTLFTGRARRKEYWYFFLVNFLISFVLGIIDRVIGMQILGSIYSLIVLLPGIAVAIRRMHDVGKSGWFILIPIYNIILCATAGEQGENMYGQDPKAEEIKQA